MSEPVRFWKMSGAGNDFIVLPGAPEGFGEDPAEFVRRVCRRGVSVGADGVLFVGPADGSIAGAQPAGAEETSAARWEAGGARRAASARGRGEGDGASVRADAVLVHYNADGGRSDFCGNGSRCAARFAAFMGFAGSPVLLLTDVGILRADIDGERVRIETPSPTAPIRKRIEAAGEETTGWFTVAGVPHLVVLVEDTEAVNVPVLGAALRSHPALPQGGANVDFLGPRSSAGKRRIRTFERGVEAETLACGSGALAAAAVLGREGETSPITLTPRSGIDLTVEFEAGGTRSFHLAGEARLVFEGTLLPRSLEGGSRA